MNHPQTLNKRGGWVSAIPEPYHGIRKMCLYCENTPHAYRVENTVPYDEKIKIIPSSLNYCGKKFWTVKAYRAHYALEHIAVLDI